jgi:MATE family multidrug resistance protein
LSIPTQHLVEGAPTASPPGRLSHELRALVALAVPVMLSRAGLLVMTTVDTVMTGWAGAEQLAFLAIGLAPFVLLMLIGTGALTGTVVLVAQAQGAGEEGTITSPLQRPACRTR